MKKPWYQSLFTSYLPWITTGIFLLGSVLDTISSTIGLITPAITYVGSLTLVLMFVVTQITLRIAPIPWISHDGRVIRIERLGSKPTLIIVGMLVALWIPRLTSLSSVSTEQQQYRSFGDIQKYFYIYTPFDTVPTYSSIAPIKSIDNNENIIRFIEMNEGRVVKLDVFFWEEPQESSYYTGNFEINICRVPILAYDDGEPLTEQNCAGMSVFIPRPTNDNDYIYYFQKYQGYRINGYFKINGIRRGVSPQREARSAVQLQIVHRAPQ